MRVTGLGLLLVLIASVSSCARPPATRYYTLEFPAGRALEPSAASRTVRTPIGVRAFDVHPPYDQDRIVYRVGESSPEVGFYAYHRWAAPLARMLTGLVVDSLRDSSEFAFEAASSVERYACYLDGTLVRLEEIDVGDQQRVRLRLDLALTTFEGAELWSDTVDAESATRTTEVREIVNEMARLLGRELAAVRPAVAMASGMCAPEDRDD